MAVYEGSLLKRRENEIYMYEAKNLNLRDALRLVVIFYGANKGLSQEINKLIEIYFHNTN
ncbi:MAG: hypothetical protein QXZ43_04560 [Candidatus Aenigmatarchaeota archaeon]